MKANLTGGNHHEVEERCKKCGKIMAEPKELIRIIRAPTLMNIIEIVCVLKEDDNVTYDLKLDGKKIGYIKILENGIERIWVNEEYRRKEYGTMLLRHVEWTAKIAGYTKMQVEAIKTDVMEFFTKNGYVLSEDEHGEYRGCKMLK